MAGMLDTLSSLMENKLLLQYMAGAGGAMSAGEPIGPALNQITQQNISTQNFAKLLAKMLGGEVPEGGKITMDSKGMKMDIPSSALGGAAAWGGVTAEAGAGGAAGAGGTAGLSEVGVRDRGMFNLLNPSSSSAISGADLAGLTPEMISQALQFKFGQTELEQKSFKDIADMIYKGQLGGYYEALAESERGGKPLDQPYPVEVPGVGEVTVRQWQALPAEEKEYAIFYHQAKKLGDTDIMSREEYRTLEPTEREQFLRAAMEDPALMTAAKEVARAGAMNLGEYLGRVGGAEDVRALKYLTDPEGLPADTTKYLASDEVQNELFRLTEDPVARRRKSAQMELDFVRRKIKSVGEVIDEVWAEDGNSITFRVRLPDGSVKEIPYAFGS